VQQDSTPGVVDVVIQGALGGLVAGTTLGLAEAFWLWRSGLDLSVLPWAWGLYGLTGLALAAPVAVVLAIVVALLGTRSLGRIFAARALTLGGAAAVVVLGAVLGRYVLNRDVFAEAMPLSATAGLLGGVLLAGVVLAVIPAPIGRLGGIVGWGAWLVGLGASLLVGVLGAPAVDRARWRTDQPAPADLADAPNVLFILVDTLRADHLDHPELLTPALDRLRADGITFDNAWSAASWTRPGVATLWTGRLPSSHTATTKGSRLPEGVVTWAEALQARGVRTGALVNNINVTAGFGFDQGFDTFHYEAPDYPFGATEGVFGLALYMVVHRVEERLTGGGGVSRYYQPADVVLGDALTWIDAQGQARWALSVHLMEPHDPYFDDAGNGYARAANPSPDPSEAAHLRDLYGHEVERLDLSLDAFLQQLRERGAYDDTLIVLTADHGEEFHEHGGWWHGSALYAEQTQVPLVIKLPGARAGGTRVPWQARTLDVPPTLTAALGVAPDPSWEGRDLLADLEPVEDEADGEEAPAVDPATACRQARGHAQDRLVVLELDFEGNEAAGVRMDGLSWYTAAPGGSRALPAQELFDVQSDPAESRNLLHDGEAICSRWPDDWASDLGVALEAARARGGDLQGSEVQMSDSERQRLCALGYLTGPECE